MNFRVGVSIKVSRRESALTLSPNAIELGKEKGWVIKAEIHEDWYEWINWFEAYHPDYGYVAGDFEQEVWAESWNTLQHFLMDIPVEEWDYGDI